MGLKILVINGSPKGQYSTTLHTCKYLQKKFTEHVFVEFDAARQIRSLEKDFTPALELIRKADVLLFSYPVYTFLVPCQLHRFLELLEESGEDLTGKWATQVTTSKHFYDVTAHRFIEEFMADLNVPFLDGLSADMDDLLKPSGQKQAIDWLRFTLWKAERGEFKAPRVASATASQAISPAIEYTATSSIAQKRVVVVADLAPEDSELQGMVELFKRGLQCECDIINIREFPFKGGCMGCFSCATSGKCIYPDHFDDFLRGTIHEHDAIIYAFRIKNHSMGSLFKMYDDRQFCNGHRTVTMGTPFGYLVAGPYAQEENLHMLLEARAQVGGNFLAGVATNEGNAEASVSILASTVMYALENPLTPPQNFFGVGGMKIFRDLIYMMRGMMRADHKFFKSHGQYDFPQKQWKTSLMMYPVGWLMGNRKIKAKMGNKMNEGMISAYRKVVEKA